MTPMKIAITLGVEMLAHVDRLVKGRIFPNRSKAIQQAVKERLDRLERSRLTRQCAKLDPAFEQAMAEEGMSEGLGQWPEYREEKFGGLT